MAGYDPSAALLAVTLPPKDAIRAGSPTCLSFVTYSTDRSSSPPTEKSAQVTYDYEPNGKLLRRREDPWDGISLAFKGGSAQPQATAVQLLAFTYYNSSNEILAPAAAPGWTSSHRCPPVSGAPPHALVQLDFSQLRQVRRVAIRLRVADARPGIPSESYTVATDVRLRNR